MTNQFDTLMATLADDQRARIDALLSDEWVDEQDRMAVSWRNFDALIDKMRDPLEMHLFYAGFSWDTGTDELARVLDHPLMDHATLLMLFWLGQPDFWLAHSAEKLGKGWEPDGRHFICAVLARLENKRMVEAKIPFDPSCDVYGRSLIGLKVEDLPRDIIGLDGTRYTIRREYVNPVGPLRG